MKQATSLLIFLFIFINTTYASFHGSYIVRNFDPDDYNGGSKIYSIVCANNGLLYTGDKNGIFEFDGTNWTKTPIGFAIYSLASDAHNNIYYAGAEGIGMLVADSLNQIKFQSFNHLVTDVKNSGTFKKSQVYRINDEILFVTGNKIVIYSDNKIRIIENNFNYIITQKINNKLYLYSIENGITTYENGEFKTVLDTKACQKKAFIGFMETNKGLILFSTDNTYTIEDNSLVEYSSILSDFNLNNRINKIQQISSNRYTLNTFYSGFLIVDQDLNVLKNINQDNNLINNTVLHIEPDNYGNIWAGTSAGISVFKENSPFSVLNTHTGLGTGYNSCLIDNELYLGTSKGLWKLTKNDQGKNEYKHLFVGHIFGLSAINQTLFFGHADGLYTFKNNQENKLVGIPSGANLKEVPFVSNTYLCSAAGGLLEISSQKRAESVQYKATKYIKGKNSINHNFEFDDLDNVWVEYENGVYMFNWNNPDKKRFFTRVENKNLLKRVFKFNDQLCFIADSGVYNYDYNDKTFSLNQPFKKIESITGKPEKIIAESNNQIWVFSKGRLFEFKYNNNKFKRVTNHDFNYINNKYPNNYENAYSLNDSISLIGSEEGFYCYNKNKIKNNTYSSVLIRSIYSKRQNNEKTRIWGAVSINNNSYAIDIVNTIPYENNSIEFNFSCGSSNYNTFYYQTFLQGYNTEYSEWTTINKKEYTNLSPGDYKFVIRGLNSFGHYSGIATCSFTITPPWYLTPIYKIIYSIAAALFVIGIIILINFLIKRANSKLKKQQMADLRRAEQKRIREKLAADKELAQLRNEKLKNDNLHKSKELANLTHSLVEKEKELDEFKNELEQIKNLSETNKIVTEDLRRLHRRLNREPVANENQEAFGQYFDTVHETFFKKLKKKYPDLTSKDLRLCAYLRMNLSTKEISPLMNISVRGVEIGRYRLRKKLDLDRNVNISSFLNKI